MYALDVEDLAAMAPPPYSQDSSQAILWKPPQRPTVTAYDVTNYDFLDCDCYDGDSWASLPVGECRCLRAPNERPEKPQVEKGS